MIMLSKIIPCSDSENEHAMRDSCWNCAPWWFHIHVCPKHDRKLASSGYCKECRKYYSISNHT